MGEILPKEHGRAFVCRHADAELEGFVLDLMQKHKLTFAETFSLLAAQVSRLASTCLKAERSK